MVAFCTVLASIISTTRSNECSCASSRRPARRTAMTRNTYTRTGRTIFSATERSGTNRLCHMSHLRERTGGGDLDRLMEGPEGRGRQARAGGYPPGVADSGRSSVRSRWRLLVTSPFVATRSHPAARAATWRRVSACPQKPRSGTGRIPGVPFVRRIAAVASRVHEARLRMTASGPARSAASKAGRDSARTGRWPYRVRAAAIRVEKRRSSPATTTVNPALISQREPHRLERQPAVVAEALGRPRWAPDHLDLAVLDAVDTEELGFHLADQLRAQRASHRRQRHLDVHGIFDDRDVVDQPQIPDVDRDLRVVTGLQDLDDLVSGDHRLHLLIVAARDIVS